MQSMQYCLMYCIQCNAFMYVMYTLHIYVDMVWHGTVWYGVCAFLYVLCGLHVFTLKNERFRILKLTNFARKPIPYQSS